MNAKLQRPPASHLRQITLLIAVGVAQLLPNIAQATTTKWSNASGGNWSNPSNWDNGVPSSTNDAVFDLPGAYTVTLDADFGIRSCDANSSGLTLVIPVGRTLSISGASAQLRVRGGSHVNSNGLIDVSGGLASIDFSNPSTNFSGSLRLLNGNLTAVGFPSVATGPATLTLNGTCTLSGLTPNGWTVVVQGSAGGGNAHTNLSGGLVNGVMRLESIDGAYAAEVQGVIIVQAGGVCNVEPGTGGLRKILGGAAIRAQGVISANADLEVEPSFQELNINDQGQVTVAAGKRLSLIGINPTLHVGGVLTMGSGAVTEIGSGGFLVMESPGNIVGELRLLNGSVQSSGYLSSGPPGPAQLLLRGICSLNSATPVWSGWTVVVQGSSAGGDAHANMPGAVTKGVLRLESIDGPYAAEVQGVISVEAGGRCDIEPGTGGTRKISGAVHVHTQGVMNVNVDLEVDGGNLALTIDDQGQVTVAAGKRLSLTGANLMVRVVGVLTMGSGAVTEIGSGGFLEMDSPGNIVGELRLLNGSVQSSGYLSSGPPGPAQLVLRGTCSLDSATPAWSGWTVVVQGSSAGGDAHANMPGAVTKGVLRLESIDGPYAAEVQGVISVEAGGRCDIEPGTGGTRKISGGVHVHTQGVMNVNVDLEVEALSQVLSISDQGQLTVAAGKRLSLTGPSPGLTVGGTLTMGSGASTEMANGALVQVERDGNVDGTVSGTVTYLGSWSLLFYIYSGSVSIGGPGTDYWPSNAVPTDVWVYGPGGLTMTVPRSVARNVSVGGPVINANQLTIGQGAEIRAGGAFLGIPAYGSALTLTYNTGGTRGRGDEWSATAGPGYPANVVITGNTTLDLGNGGPGVARQCGGDLTVNPGSLLSMNNSPNEMTAPLTVLGNVAGAVTLSTLAGADLNVTGSLNTVTIIGNGRTILFQGNGTQAVDGNLSSIGRLVLAKGGGSVQLFSNVVAGSQPGSDGLQFNGTTDVLDLNGRQLHVVGSIGGTNPSGGFRGSPSSVLTLDGSAVVGSVNFLAGAQSLASLIVDRPGGSVSLATPLTLTSSLALTSGKVITGANTLTIAAGGTVTGASASSYVQGNLRKTVPISGGAGSASWEIGDATRYAPVDLATTTGAASFDVTASTAAGDHASLATSGLERSRTVNRTWSLQSAPTGNFATASLTFHFDPADVDPGATTANFIVRKFDAPSTWTSTGIGARTATSTQATGVTGFSDFQVGSELHLSIADVAAPEGDSGTTPFNFNVTLSETSADTVKVSYQSADGSATIADNDYVTSSGTLVFLPGTTSRTTTVQVKGDFVTEPDETYRVDLSRPVRATIVDGQGVGTIQDDEAARLLCDEGYVTNGGVNAMVQVGGTIYIGGQFSQLVPVGGGPLVARNNVAAIDAASGLPTAWNPNVGGVVRSLAVSGGTVYMAGLFSIVGGQTRYFVAAVDATTGQAKSWDPGVEDFAYAIAVSGGTVFIGGDFSQVGGASHPYLAAVDAVSGATVPCPSVNNVVHVLAASDGIVYAGGEFTSVGGQSRSYLASFDAGTGSLTGLGPTLNGIVYSIDATGPTVYAGGDFTTVNGIAHAHIVAIDKISSVVSSWAPQMNGTVTSLAVDGGRVYAGGSFTGVGAQSRNRIAALDPSTGALDVWDPNANANVDALVASGGTVYAGGGFNTMGGAPRQGFTCIHAINQISIADATAIEGTGGATEMDFKVALTYASATAVTVDYTDVEGSALETGDFEGTTGTLTFAPGQATQTITVPIVTDSEIESDETFVMQLSTPVGAVLGNAQATGTIQDDDAGRIVCTTLDVANGPVYAMAENAGTLYLGGSFTHVGPMTGSGVPLDATTGAAQYVPLVAGGRVAAAAHDGAGGWYIGGSFTHVAGVRRSGLAHLLADHTLSPWNPGASDLVEAIAVSGNTVYVGGEFSAIAGQTRSYIAAIDGTTGAPTPWNPNADGSVLTLAASGGVVYAGGWFTTIGGQPRNHLAALDGLAGLATAWNPGADGGPVYALALHGSTLYVAGAFTSLGSQPRPEVGAIDVASGVTTSWAPAPPDNEVYAIAASAGTVYIGGDFDAVGGSNRYVAAALDSATADVTGWQPNPAITSGYANVTALAVSGNRVYLGGQFDQVGGGAHLNLAAVDNESGDEIGIDVDADSPVYALAVSGNTVFAGGDLTSIGGAYHRNLAALNEATGHVTAWAPNADAPVWALAASGSLIYAGGDFVSVGGTGRNRIAALNATTGLATSWNPNANATVRALAVSASTIYAGGSFSTIGGQTRNRIAALDVSTGLATAFNPNPTPGPFGSYVLTLAVSGNIVYAGGGFTGIGGQTRNLIGAVDAVTGNATAWDPNASGASTSNVTALWVNGATVYAGGAFTAIGGQSRNNIAALSVGTGQATSWNPNANGLVFALTGIGGRVYAGGSFATIGGQPRNKLAALDATSGAAVTIDPSTDNTVTAIAQSGSKLYAGGYFMSVGGLPHRSVVCFDTPGLVGVSDDDAVAEVAFSAFPNPSRGSVWLRYALPRAAHVRISVYDVQGRLMSRPVDAILPAGRHETMWNGSGESGTQASGLYFVRFEAAGRRETKRLVFIR